MKNYILILGANSDIAKAIARKYAENGFNLFLAAREVDRLKSFANDLKIRHEIDAKLVEFDALNFESHREFYASLDPKPIGSIVVFGYLGVQEQAQNNFNESHKIIDTNYTGAVSILNVIANDYEKSRNGFLVGISSVAGDRGRKSNYIYGSAKAGFTAYLSGLRNRLHRWGIQVLTVKPGFVDTQMTKGMNLPKRLTAKPEEVAEDIYMAQISGKELIYTKSLWKLIMSIIEIIPEKVFKRLSI